MPFQLRSNGAQVWELVYLNGSSTWSHPDQFFNYHKARELMEQLEAAHQPPTDLEHWIQVISH